VGFQCTEPADSHAFEVGLNLLPEIHRRSVVEDEKKTQIDACVGENSNDMLP
jgi:hypothetical protein